jgi:hypothetical protein
MRLLILFFLLITASHATDSVSYFNSSSENKLLCHVGQYSFKMVSQKNACQPLKDKKEGVIF